MKNAISKIKSYEKKNKFGVKFLKKSGELTKNAKSAINNCSIENRKIYAKRYEGSGRHIRLVDNSAYIIGLLNILGYKFSTSNDAPMGGKQGDFIKCSKIAIETLLSLV